MRLGVVAKTHRADHAELVCNTLNWLVEQGCGVLVDREVVAGFRLEGFKGVDRSGLAEQVDLLVVFGGDGTLLSAARLVESRPTPILGVNLGSLGFLTEVTLGEVKEVLQRVLTGDYQTSSRCLLEVGLQRKGAGPQSWQALNDAVINKAALARIIALDTYCGDDFIATFMADGMIVSTPTGSTAYSLSAGGPIVFPTEDLIVLTPICPHTLTNRPLIVPATSNIRIVLRAGDDVMLTIDGQVGTEMLPGDVLTCTRAQHRIQLIQPGNRSFFDILREKLRWGERSGWDSSSQT